MFIKKFEDINMKDISTVGGKNASIGEMIQNLPGIRIPSGFAVTVEAYKHHLHQNNLEEKIENLLKKIDKNDLKNFAKIGKEIRKLISKAPMPKDLQEEIISAYKKMGKNKVSPSMVDVAVRSSATAEDLPHASFAGQQETFLNVNGEKKLLQACLDGFASLFTDRAISYRIDHGFDHNSVFISVGVQKMVRSDLGCAGVSFTLDTETGHRGVIFINSSYGLGENVVKGVVNPDEFYVHKTTLKKGFKPVLKKRLGTKNKKLVYEKNGTKNISVPKNDQKKFSLTDDEILEIAKQSLMIEEHYSKKNKESASAFDIEWAKDGKDGKIYIVQARPETVHSTNTEPFYEEFFLDDPKKNHQIIARGKNIGKKIASGKARVIVDPKQMSSVKPGEILVTEMTDPDWEPIMKKAGGIITNSGGRTCHAAIVSRELGIPAVVGTNAPPDEIDVTKTIKTGQEITIDCSKGEGLVYNKKIPFHTKKIPAKKTANASHSKVEIMMNIGNPDIAFHYAQFPNDGVGLARIEFIINSAIKIHPMALVHPEKVDKKCAKKIDELTFGYKDKKLFFIDKLAQEAGTIAAAFYPKPVIIRMSDFKSNEYKKLIGGEFFEPEEENPMIGFRGASRYYHENYREAFALECLAMKKIRNEMGLKNVKLMIPFVRTPKEGKLVIDEMKKQKIISKDLEIYMMCEIPSNVIDIDNFCKIFDGLSIGSNDLTQTTLGVDRDSALISPLFDEQNDAVKKMISMAIKGAKKNKKKIGICGQAPSDYPDFAKFLIKEGIDSISLNPDTALKQF